MALDDAVRALAEQNDAVRALLDDDRAEYDVLVNALIEANDTTRGGAARVLIFWLAERLPSSPNGAHTSRQPGGVTPSCLPSRATKIFAFCSPKPGSALTCRRRCRPSAADVQTAAASPSYFSTTSRQSACTRLAIEPGNRCSAGCREKTAASSSGS